MFSNFYSPKPRLVFLLCSPLMHLMVLGMSGCAASDPPLPPAFADADALPAEPLTLEAAEGR